MSSSQHPIALAIERQVGGATKLLATVMCLPLIDGVFPALLLAGAVDSTAGILEVGLVVFGGSATVAVILADMDGSPREQVLAVLGVGAILLPVAAIEAAIAPTIESLLTPWVFERFAALVILTIAAKTASARIGDLLPRPGFVIAIGLLASLNLEGAQLALTTDPSLIVRGVAAAAVGVGFALAIALLGPWLRGVVDLDRFRFGSAVALGVLPLSIFGYVDVPLALAVLAISGLLAFDPDQSVDDSAGPAVGPVTDGGEQGDVAVVVDAADDRTEDDADPTTSERDHAPWL
jgi:hypothetical protein